MPVTNTVTVVSYAGNNSSVTPYPLDEIERDRDEELFLQIDGVDSSDFTISPDGLQTGTAIPNTSTLVIFRKTNKTQEQPFPSNTTPAAEDVRAAVDKLTLIAQEIDEEARRSIKPPIGSTFGASSTLGLDANGNPISRTAEEEVAHLGIKAIFDSANAASTAATAAAATANVNAAASTFSATAAAGSAAAAAGSAAVALEPQAPLQLTEDPVNIGSGEITGILTPDATGELYQLANLELDGFVTPYYSTDPEDGYPATRVYYAGSSWIMVRSTGNDLIPYATWLSDPCTLVECPHPGLATGWTPSFSVGLPAATGTPVVTWSPPTTGYTAVVTNDGEKTYWVNQGSLAFPDWNTLDTEVAQRDFIRGTSALGRMYSRLFARADTGSASFTVAVQGDSYATAPITALRSLYGEVGYFSTIQPSLAFAGGAAPSVDYAQSPNGFFVNLGAGQSITYDNSGRGLLGSQLKALYQVLPTAGTFRIQVSVNGGGYTDLLTVDASVSVNGPEAAAMAVANVSPSNLGIRIVGVSGQCRIIGLGIDFGALSGLSNRHGIRNAQVNTGGTTPAQWNATPQHIYNAMYGGANGLSPDIVFFKGDDGAAAWLADFPPLIAKIQAASPDTAIVVQGRHPTTANPSNTELHADDIALMEMCESNGWLYIPSRLYFPPAGEMQAAGLLRQGDGGVHLTNTGGFFQEDITLQWLGPIARGVWNLEIDSNARNKGYLHGYQGVSSTTPGVPLNWVCRGDMNLIGGQIGFQNLSGNTAANPGNFTGMQANPFIAGNDTHKGGLALRVNDVTRQFINRNGRIISGGGNYSVSQITNSMNGAYTLLSGTLGSDNGLVLGTVNSPNPSTSPLELKVNAGFNANGTAVMRMHNTTGKLRYLGSGSAAMTGAFNLVSGVATINTTAVETNDHINLTLRTPGGTMGLRYSVTIVNGVSFTITAVNATGATVTSDTSSGTWEIASGRL